MSTNVNTELATIRKKLKDTLGENFNLYTHHLKNWFTKKCSKEDFDLNARRMMSPDTIHLHNQFFLAILTKCQSLVTYVPPSPMKMDGRSPEILRYDYEKAKKPKVKKKSKSSKVSMDQRFQSINLLDAIPEGVDTMLHNQEKSLQYCAKEGTLPDVGLLHGRLLVVSWEEGLDSCDDKAVSMLMVAVQHFLKNVITSALATRNAWRTREGFKYNMGCSVPNPHLLNSQTSRFKMASYTASSIDATLLNDAAVAPLNRPQSEKADANAVYEAALSSRRKRIRSAFSLFDLLAALKADANVIPNHTVRSINMERIVMRLGHEENPLLETELWS